MPNRVVPLEFNWSMSPCGAGFNLRWKDGGVCEVTAFVEEMCVGPTTREVYLRYDFDSTHHFESRTVLLRFEGVCGVRTSPTFDHDAAKDELEVLAHFDFSGLPEGSLGRAPFEIMKQIMNRYYNRWVETGVCPNPGCYVVEASDWLRDSLQNREGVQHYLLIDREMFIELTARELHVDQIVDR